MKLTFLYHPVTDLDGAVAFYRDALGWEEAWREGTSTAAFVMPGSTVQLMLDASNPDDTGGPSGFYEVADVDAFYSEHRDSLTWVELPQDSPPVRFASFTDPAGALFRIFNGSE